MLSKTELRTIPIELVVANEHQPRKVFNIELLKELASTIKKEGLIQPIVVRPIASGKFEIVAGERRWRAAQLAQIHEIECLIRNYSDQKTAEIAIIENIQRVNLNPIDEAKSYQDLIEKFELTQDEVAAIVGKSREKIAHVLGLLKLDKYVQAMISEGKISKTHGKALATVPLNLQHKIAIQSKNNKWSTREFEKKCKILVKSIKPVPQSNTSADADILALQRSLSDYLGCSVKLIYNKSGKGKVEINFSNIDVFDGLMQKIGYKK